MHCVQIRVGDRLTVLNGEQLHDLTPNECMYMYMYMCCAHVFPMDMYMCYTIVYKCTCTCTFCFRFLCFQFVLFVYCAFTCTCGSSFFLGKVTALGVLCCFALFVCLTLLASFFHLSFKNMYVHVLHVHVCTCTCMSMHVLCVAGMSIYMYVW